MSTNRRRASDTIRPSDKYPWRYKDSEKRKPGILFVEDPQAIQAEPIIQKLALSSELVNGFGCVDDAEHLFV